MQVGRYEILEIIGTGATGRVARAHDPMIGRIVAIKLLSQSLAKGEGRQKFLQEARVVGQLSHPAITTLHDMGIDEATSTPYLVMEYLDGQPLDRLLEKGSIPLPRACAWIAEVASALAVAHRKGVIHGDVKPANIIITSENRVKLTDFGIAKDAELTALTAANCTVGTAAYMSPEQCKGEKLLSAKSDLYSMGVVFYELLTGRKPFQAESPIAMFEAHVYSTFERPSRFVMDIPVWLDFDDQMKKQEFPFTAGVPNVVVIDAAGHLRYSHSGQVGREQFAQMTATIESLRKEAVGAK